MFSQEKYLKALNFAAKAHGEQKTPSNIPFISHLSEVVMEIIYACIESKLELEKTDKAVSVALLRNTIEDTDVTYDEIYTEFGIDIAEAVDALTKDKSLCAKEQMEDSINKLLTQTYEIQMVELAYRITTMQKPPKSFDAQEIFKCYKEAKLILSCLRNSNVYLSKRLEDKINNYIIYIK